MEQELLSNLKRSSFLSLRALLYNFISRLLDYGLFVPVEKKQAVRQLMYLLKNKIKVLPIIYSRVYAGWFQERRYKRNLPSL